MPKISPFGEHYDGNSTYWDVDFPFQKVILKKIDDSNRMYFYKGYSHQKNKPDFINWIEKNSKRTHEKIEIVIKSINKNSIMKAVNNELIYEIDLNHSFKNEFMDRFRICISSFYNQPFFDKATFDESFYTLNTTLDQYNYIFAYGNEGKLFIDGHPSRFYIDEVIIDG